MHWAPHARRLVSGWSAHRVDVCWGLAHQRRHGANYFCRWLKLLMGDNSLPYKCYRYLRRRLLSISAEVRKEILKALVERYRTADWADRSCMMSL